MWTQWKIILLKSKSGSAGEVSGIETYDADREAQKYNFMKNQ